MLLLCLLTIGLAFPAHRWIKSFWIATLASGLLGSVVLQMIAALQLGYMDKFFPIGLAIGAIIGLAVSAVTGGALRFWTRRTSVRTHDR